MAKLPEIKARPRVAQIFAVIIAGIISVSTVLTFGVIFVLLRLKIDTVSAIVTSTTYMGIFTTVIGIGIAAYTSTKMLSPIIKINDAAKKVSRGDFSVRLEEKNIAKEIEEIATSFNIMVKELSNTETLRSDFVSNVSHEFKTPLSAIEGYATLLQDERLSKEEQAVYVSRILENTSRLSKLTQSILSLSQLENQEIVLQKESYMLDEQIRRVLLGYEPIWEEKELSIDLALESTPFYGSKSLLAQVWSNLIDNAIKFSHQGGALFLSCWEFDGKVVVRIRDNGIGMSEEVRAHAFDKFYQGERSHAGQGSGLGLALVRRIVLLNGGEIELMSREGKGTEITITLRAETPPNQA
jgi:signal transduction histidine kinase